MDSHPSRRSFLQQSLGLSGGAISSAVGSTISASAIGAAIGLDPAPAVGAARRLKIERTTETRSICPYCSVSCGVIIHTRGAGKNTQRQVLHVEGDPDHPINQGTLCPKGASLRHYIENDRRLTTVRHRRPGGAGWEPLSFDEAIARIARLIKDTRDADFVETDEKGRTVNRLTSLAAIGGCTDTNEFNWLFQKTARALGIVHLEQQSRI